MAFNSEKTEICSHQQK